MSVDILLMATKIYIKLALNFMAMFSKFRVENTGLLKIRENRKFENIGKIGFCKITACLMTMR